MIKSYKLFSQKKFIINFDRVLNTPRSSNIEGFMKNFNAITYNVPNF